MADALNHNLFSTTGTLYFIGGLLTIVIIGLFILLLAVIVEVVAWITMPTIMPSKRRTTYFYSFEPKVEEPVF